MRLSPQIRRTKSLIQQATYKLCPSAPSKVRAWYTSTATDFGALTRTDFAIMSTVIEAVCLHGRTSSMSVTRCVCHPPGARVVAPVLRTPTSAVVFHTAWWEHQQCHWRLAPDARIRRGSANRFAHRSDALEHCLRRLPAMRCCCTSQSMPPPWPEACWRCRHPSLLSRHRGARLRLGGR